MAIRCGCACRATIRLARRGDVATGIPLRSRSVEHAGRTRELGAAVLQHAGTWSLRNVPRTYEPITGPYPFMAEYRGGSDAACATTRPAP